MRVIVFFMFLLGVALAVILSKFEMPEEVKVILISALAGIIFFVVVSELIYTGLSSKDRGKATREKIAKRKRKSNIIGLILMLIFSLFFFNFYLYFKTMLGNDLLISLEVKNQNLNIKNGENILVDVKGRVLANPFCSADCLLALDDLSEGENVFYDNVSIKVSSPLSKEYSINPNEEKEGQKLYKVTLDCKSVKTRFCYSNVVSKSRTKIISVDYKLNDVQMLIKDKLKNDTETLNKEFYSLENTLKSFDFYNPYLNLSYFRPEYNALNNSLYEIYPRLLHLNELYSLQEYSQLGTEIYLVSADLVNLTDRFYSFNSSFYGKFYEYNSFVDNVSIFYGNVSYLEDYSFSEFSLSVAENFVENFNLFLLRMNSRDKFENKLDEFNEITSEFSNLTLILQSENETSPENFSLGVQIDKPQFGKLQINQVNYTSYFNLNEPSPMCCLYGECYNCINNPYVNYPIIFVHGHSFNERLSAELSMESFGEMARALEKEGYIDAGYFYGKMHNEDYEGYLGRVNASVLVEATYYIDSLVTEENSFIFDSKWETIDTYASRLNEIVSNVKYITGKDKVIIVAHSMGGLVTRRYMQLYGEDSLEKVMLIGIPNHGVDGFVLNYCPVFGADVECSEMNKSSSFISELTNASLPDIPVSNVVGVGCFWEGSDGDGIVKSSSAYLEGTKNIYVNGTCDGVDFFHVRMIKPSKHPEIYSIVKEFIEKE